MFDTNTYKEYIWGKWVLFGITNLVFDRVNSVFETQNSVFLSAKSTLIAK